MNVGTLWRSAHILGADFIFTVGRRYRHQSSDTTKAWKSIPLWHFNEIDELLSHSPKDARLVGVELDERATDLSAYSHPERAIYLLGAEDHGIPEKTLDRCHDLIQLPGDYSMNVATAGSIVLYDRIAAPANTHPGAGAAEPINESQQSKETNR